MKIPYQLNPFVVADPNKCIGCRVCELACSTVHAHEKKPLTVGSMKNPLQPRLYLVRTPYGSVPVQCRHCEDAPCANACPVSAIVQKDGAICINEELCMGCKTCILACPFGAIKLMPVFKDGLPVQQNVVLDEDEYSNESVGYKQLQVAGKCDRCINLEHPACVENCPEHALQLIVPENHRDARMQEAALSLGFIVKDCFS
jgi:electron transport protein HydN